MDDDAAAQVSRGGRAGRADPPPALRPRRPARPPPVSRDEAAAAAGVPRATVAFHLDRLVDDGLLDVDFERRTGRTGPGRRAAVEALPAGRLRRRGLPARAALRPGRRAAGRGDGRGARTSGESPPDGAGPAGLRARPRARRAARGAAATGRDAVAAGARGARLRAAGRTDGAVTLANCPFHALAREHTELVCGMNLRLLDGRARRRAGAAGLDRRACSPRPGRCCVRLEPSTRRLTRRVVDSGRARGLYY